MRRLKDVIMVLAGIWIMAIAGCSSSSSDNHAEQGSSPEESSASSVKEVLAIQGFEVISSVTRDGDTGYLAMNEDEKQCLVLQGSPYNIGFEMGMLLPKGTALMTQKYPSRLIESFLGIPQQQNQELFELILDVARDLCEGAITNEHAIPDYLLEEMKGLAAGATKAGSNVSFEDVLLLNEGMDALFAILFTGIVPNLDKIIEHLPGNENLIQERGGRIFFPNARPESIGCNGFVLSGDATVGGKVYHGRDFMFETGGIYHNEALTAVYLPDEGLPFVTVTAPGFVGQTTGLNSRGLSMGMDVVFGGATRSTPGTGCLFVLRDIVQHCGNLQDAVERMKVLNRGVAWLYVVADDEWSNTYTNGIVVEEGMRADEQGTVFTSGPDLLSPWQHIQYAGLIMKYNALDQSDREADRGVMYRSQSWGYPAGFMGEQGFPGQREVWDDVVLTTNHYIIPNMIFTNMTPWMSLIGPYFTSSSYSEDRYEDLYRRIDKVYGKIDFATARDLIDFLNPNRGEWNYYFINGPVEGHHDIYANQELIAEFLYGYYHPDEPWVRIDLKPFLELGR